MTHPIKNQKIDKPSYSSSRNKEIYQNKIQSLFISDLNAKSPFLSKDQLIEAVKTPELFFKKGNSATVYQIKYQHQSYIVKRYNIKSITHFLRRFFRPSRAWQSWESARLLEKANIKTLTPIALLEKRFLGMRKSSYFISNHLTGINILEKFQTDYYKDSPPNKTETNALIQLFENLQQSKISHGDLKGTNILWHNHQWVLIDLDAVKKHNNKALFQKAYQKDRDRFLKNWQDNAFLFDYFDKVIPKFEIK